MTTRKIIDGPVEAMTHPVVCQCGAIYDIGAIKEYARYVDATVWNAPCCGVTADDRKWVNQPYRDLVTEPYFDKFGMFHPAETDSLTTADKRKRVAASKRKAGRR